MKILAIWERPQANKRYGGIFVLTDDEKFLHLSHDREFAGTDKKGAYVYHESGLPEWGPAFHDEDEFDFDKADFWISNFGGVLVKDFREEEKL